MLLLRLKQRPAIANSFAGTTLTPTVNLSCSVLQPQLTPLEERAQCCKGSEENNVT